MLEAIIDEAHKHGLKATVHTFDEEAAIEALEAGANGLEHGILEEEMKGNRVIELLLRNNASYVPTLWFSRSTGTYARSGMAISSGSQTRACESHWAPTAFAASAALGKTQLSKRNVR